jgi:hypothetical protein
LTAAAVPTEPAPTDVRLVPSADPGKGCFEKAKGADLKKCRAISQNEKHADAGIVHVPGFQPIVFFTIAPKTVRAKQRLA